jgi:magnesium chelatase accessory protein
MYRKLEWSRQGADWPHREHSHFVKAAGFTWHVQIIGQGPVLLLLHGTGASTHSWHKLVPILAKKYTTVAVDLPGHGFSDTPAHVNGMSKLSLPSMSNSIAVLLLQLNLVPTAIIGHSAGAAIGAQMILDGTVRPDHLIAINGAFKPFGGLAALVFPVVAKLVVVNPITILGLAAGAKDPRRTAKLMDSTGSKLDAITLGLYARLFQSPGHIAGVLGMMANWDLGKLALELANFKARLTLIVGDGDRMISPQVSIDIARRVAGANVVTLAGLGHLAHEEAPQIVADAIDHALGSTTDPE